MLVKVAIDLALDRLFTYEVPVELSGEIKVGQLLRVPFGYREARGFALEVSDDAETKVMVGRDDPIAPILCGGMRSCRPTIADTTSVKIKPIFGIADPAPFFSPEMLKLVRWISDYTCSPIELCLKAAVPAAVLKPNAKPKQLLFVEPVSLDNVKDSVFTAYQRELLENIRRVGGGWVQQLCREFSTTPNTLRAIEEKGGVVIDGRNIYERHEVEAVGLKYLRIG